MQPKATTEVPKPLTQTNATASRHPQLISTTEIIKPTESTASELQALQALEALDSIDTPESTVKHPIPQKKVPIRPTQSRLPIELLNSTTKTTAAKINTVVNRDVKRRSTEPFRVPTIAPRPPRPISPQFAHFNPALVSWSAQQAAVQHTTTIAPTAKKVVIHNYYGSGPRPGFGDPLRLSRHQFKRYCRTVPKSTADHWAQQRRQSKSGTQSESTSN